MSSIVLVICATAFIGWYYRTTADNIISNQVQTNNISIAKVYTNTVWKEHREVVKIIYDIASQDRAEYVEYVNFGKDTVRFLQEIPIARFNLYSPNGEPFIRTTHNTLNISGTDNNLNENVSINIFDIIKDGKPQSEIVEDAQFYTAGGKIKEGILVRTLIPIMSENYVGILSNQKPELDGVIEIYYDVTDAIGVMRNFQYIGAGFILVIFGILFTLLIYTSRRAEKIIEKQHETNVELTSAKVKAETENKQKSQFVANISHELRTPLNAIIGFSEIMKDEVMGPIQNEQYQSYTKDIHAQGVHLLSLINDILDYSKAESGKLELEYEEIDLNKMVAVCLRTQEPRANSAQVALVKDLPSEHIIITSDAKRLKQILLNLLSNAVKFTPAEGSVKVSIWENISDKRIGIEVEDTGIGIAPKDIAKALSPFGQVDSELSRKYEGTGLGLPLTKKFTELLRGELKIHSEVGKGTKITILLPKDNKEEMIQAQHPLPNNPKTSSE